MSEGKKSLNDILVVDGEFSDSRFRGVLLKWSRHFDENVGADLRTNPGKNPSTGPWRRACSWLDRKVEEDWWDWIQEEWPDVHTRQIAEDFLESNEEFRDVVERNHVWVATSGKVLGEGLEEPSNSGVTKKSDGDGQHQDQKSFAASSMPHLYGFDIVTDSGVPRWPKVRGLMLAALRDMDEVMCEGSYPGQDDFYRAFIYWGKDKFGEEWYDFLINYAPYDKLSGCVATLMSDNDEFEDLLQEKATPNSYEGAGNPNTDEFVEEVFADLKAKREERKEKRVHSKATSDNPNGIGGFAEKHGSKTPEQLKEERKKKKEEIDNRVKEKAKNSEVKKKKKSGHGLDRFVTDENTSSNGKSKTKKPKKPKRETKSGDVLDIEFTGQDIFNEDCLDVVETMVEKGHRIDAIITDPPYEMDYSSRGERLGSIMGDEKGSGAMDLAEDVFKKAKIVMNRGSPVISFCNDYNIVRTMEIVDRWFDFKQTLVWDKEWIGMGGGGEFTVKWRNSHEVAVFGMYGDATFENPNRHDGDVHSFKRMSGDEMVHPTQKPIEYLRYLIESTVPENGVVFDPFAGSGTTLLAARQTGRGFVGAELDPEFYEVIQGRLNQQTLV